MSLGVNCSYPILEDDCVQSEAGSELLINHSVIRPRSTSRFATFRVNASTSWFVADKRQLFRRRSIAAEAIPVRLSPSTKGQSRMMDSINAAVFEKEPG